MTSRRTRVLHVIQNLNYGGMERVLADIVLRTDASRFESHVLCLQYLGRFSQGLEGAATLHLGPKMSSGSMLWPRALAETMRRIAPDVVHSHSGVWHKSSLAARLARVPWIVHTEHGRAKPDPLQNRIVDGLAARRTDRIVAVSPQLARELPRTLRTRAEKIVMVSNGVDTDAYRPRTDTGALRRELGLATGVPIIGSIGRLEPIKGYDVMIEAFAILRARHEHHDAVLVVGGQGSTREALGRLVHDRGLDGRVHLLGWRDDPHDLLSAFTIFTMSSRSEGTSISLLEAMSAALAPVVTDVGGNRAVLGSPLDEEGLVPTESPRELADRWAALLANPDRRARMGRLARERVLAAYGVDAMVRAYCAIYEERPPAGASERVRGVPPSPRNSAECPPVM